MNLNFFKSLYHIILFQNEKKNAFLNHVSPIFITKNSTFKQIENIC